MHFIKGVAKWATIWTVLITGFFVISEIRKGEPMSFGAMVMFAILVWFAMAALITISRLRTFIESLSFSAAQRIVQPSTGGAEGDRRAIQEASVAAGFKARPPAPPTLPGR